MKLLEFAVDNGILELQYSIKAPVHKRFAKWVVLKISQDL